MGGAGSSRMREMNRPWPAAMAKEGGRHNESCVGCLFVLKGCILPSPYFTMAVAAAEEEEGEADRLPLPAASHLASLSLSPSPSPLSALPSCQRRLNLTQVRGGASTSLSPSSSSFLPSPKRPFRSCVSIALVARRHPGHLAPVTRSRSPKWSWRASGWGKV